jgi:hypothetical protein
MGAILGSRNKQSDMPISCGIVCVSGSHVTYAAGKPLWAGTLIGEVTWTVGVDC